MLQRLWFRSVLAIGAGAMMGVGLFLLDYGLDHFPSIARVFDVIQKW